MKTCMEGKFINDGEMKEAKVSTVDSIRIDAGVMVARYRKPYNKIPYNIKGRNLSLTSMHMVY